MRKTSEAVSMKMPTLVRLLIADLATQHGLSDMDYLTELIRRETLAIISENVGKNGEKAKETDV